MLQTRDSRIVAGVALWVVSVLGLDTSASVGQQRLLGVGTWLVLGVALWGEDRTTRVQVGVVVVYATIIEYVFAGWLGVYVYRLENVPAFVPPGHGLIYLAAFAIGRSAWAHRQATWLVPTALGIGGCWAVWGVTLSPQQDLLGAWWFGCLLLFAWKGRSPLLYAGAFFVVSYLELVGTSLGTWTWSTSDPTGLLSIGNPPSGIAGGYAFFDAAALFVAPRLLTRWDARRRRRGSAGGALSAGHVGVSRGQRAIRAAGGPAQNQATAVSSEVVSSASSRSS